MLDDRWKVVLRILIYPIQFDTDPSMGVERLLGLMDRRCLPEQPQEYLAAIQAGLESSEGLADLIPQPHSEEVIRGYLRAVRERLG